MTIACIKCIRTSTVDLSESRKSTSHLYTASVLGSRGKIMLPQCFISIMPTTKVELLHKWKEVEKYRSQKYIL